MTYDVRTTRYGQIALLLLLGFLRGIGYSVLILSWSAVSSLYTFGLVLSHDLIPELAGANPQHCYQLAVTIGMMLLAVHLTLGLWPFHWFLDAIDTLVIWVKKARTSMCTKGTV
jgi:Na+-transporting NADH:ubiquinone oxidoreductase subunit NqrD